MRAILYALTLAFALAACQHMAGPAAAPDTPPAASAAETAADAPPPEAPAPEAPAPDIVPAPVPPPEPPMLSQERHLCERSGGTLMPRAPGLYACVHPTRDANRTCDEASDCEGLCLARSGTCAPFTPLYGCQEVFTLRNRRETLCTE